MDPRIEILPVKTLAGKRMRMSLADNKTYDLWRSFMPRRNEIRNTVSSDLYSVQVYDDDFDFEYFDPSAEFDKWAAMEIPDSAIIPDGMEAFTLEGGLYAVFIHRGPASGGERTFRYIFGEWMPGSGYETDNRPHFEILGEKYKKEDPASEEEVWIPVRERRPKH